MIIALTKDRFFADQCHRAFGAEKFIETTSYEDVIANVLIKADTVVVVDIQTVEPFDLTLFKCGVVAVTGVPKFSEAVQLMKYGIRGYGNRAMRVENLRQAVNSVRSGQVWMPPDIIAKLMSALPDTGGENEGDVSSLTERELEVARLVAKGMTNKEVADIMNVTVRTVKAHMTSIFSKTGLRDRVALALRFK
jgi:DNA-binding NarL/FixJ family response regulator